MNRRKTRTYCMILIDLVHIMVFLGLVGGFRMSDSYPPWDVYIYLRSV